MKINPLIESAYSVLDGADISPETALGLATLNPEDTLDLLSLARKVTRKFAPPNHVCSIISSKTGLCSQDCRYCAQSSKYPTDLSPRPLLTIKETLAEAETAVQNGVDTFGLVTSGYGYTEANEEFKQIIATIRALKDKYPDLKICASLGILSDETASALAESGVRHYNHNLQVNPQNYARLVATTHAYEERVNTVLLAKKHGMGVCCGGIIGMGETPRDRIELAFILKQIDADVIPLNVLVPIAGTPLGERPVTPAVDVAKTFAVFRLIHPRKTIKFAAGRETVMKDFQGMLMLAGANGMLTGGYLTTRGRAHADDRDLIGQVDLF